MNISFLLNGETVTATVSTGVETLLDHLREDQQLCGTKEGCNEGDCGACSVIMTDESGKMQPVNACILLLPQLQGKSIRTVEGVSGPQGQLHPVQSEMIEKHGAQCGFCTPGFITTMAAAHANGETDFDGALAGNLCRCTGYAPIIRAAQAAAGQDVPQWMQGKPAQDDDLQSNDVIFCPANSDALAQWYVQNPSATLVAGGTDVGLWVTKKLETPSPIAFLGYCTDLMGISDHGDTWRIGAMTTIADVKSKLGPDYPSFDLLLARYGSPQVRAMATLGGNIANGSPIGDSPPALIAMGADVELRQGDDLRRIKLEDFFITYGQQDRKVGEFVSAIYIPKPQENLRCYKLSKRFDQDISAVCGCFNIATENGRITDVCIAFGGMAGIPARAKQAEAVLIGAEWGKEIFEQAAQALANDFSPMSDMRASAEYRQNAAQNMLRRYYLELDTKAPLTVLEVQA